MEQLSSESCVSGPYLGMYVPILKLRVLYPMAVIRRLCSIYDSGGSKAAEMKIKRVDYR